MIEKYNNILLNALASCEVDLGVNFTNILWAAFAPKSFCAKILLPKITNPNFKHIKAAQRALVWLSISPIFYKQLYHTKVLYAAFMCVQFGFLIFWQKDFGAKAAHKMLVKLTPNRTCNWGLNDQPFLLLKIELVLLEQPIFIFELIVENIAETIFKWKNTIFVRPFSAATFGLRAVLHESAVTP